MPEVKVLRGFEQGRLDCRCREPTVLARLTLVPRRAKRQTPLSPSKIQQLLLGEPNFPDLTLSDSRQALDLPLPGRYPETDIAAYGVKQFSQLNDPYKMAGNVEFLHAQMYALASKLGIQELFDVSRVAFQRRYSHLNCHTRDDWVALVGFIYNSTKPKDDDLWKIVLHGLQHALAYDHPTIHDGNLADVLKVVPELAYDALTTKISRQTQIWRIQCTEYQTLVLDRCAHGFAVDCTKACCREALSNTECMTCGCIGMTGDFDG